MSHIHRINFHRNSLGHLLNFLGLSGSGVEIGVFTGDFSSELLRTWRGERLYLVDPWRSMDDYIDDLNHHNMDDAYHTMLRNIQPYQDRAVVCRATSLEAVVTFADESLDFAYIDANHEYGHIMQDMDVWYPKIKKGGILCGHDFTTHVSEFLIIQGEAAVTDWGMKNNVSDVLVADCSSWFIRKQ